MVMNAKQAKRLRKLVRMKYPNLSDTPTYNLSDEQMTEGKETLYLTVDCKKFYYKQLKNKYKRGENV